MKPRKTRRYEIRVTEQEKKLLENVSKYSSTDTSEVVRESALFTAGTILALERGEITPEEAGKAYSVMLARLANIQPDITEVSIGYDVTASEKPGKGEKGAEVAP